MRVAYVINGFDPGGAEHGLLTLIENGFFQEQQVSVLGFCRGRGQLADKIKNAVGADNFKVARDEKSLSFFGMLFGGWALVLIILKQRPEAVILSLKQANLVGRLVLIFFPWVRCISFEHIIDYRARRFEWVYKYLLWLTSFRVGEIWADTQKTLDQTQKYFMTVVSRRKSIVPLFSTTSIHRKTNFSIDGTIRIVAAGRLVSRKKFNLLIEAVVRMRSTGADICLDIFGDGPEFAELQQQIDVTNSAENIRLLGYRENWFLQAVDYDIFVNASEMEGFCIVVAEAMSVGLPVLATDVGGITDYGNDEANMAKLKTNDVGDIVSKLQKMIDDKLFRQKIGTQAAEDMQQKYSPESLRERGKTVLSI